MEYKFVAQTHNPDDAMTKEQALNEIIKGEEIETNLISDGYHTFGELYDHRITLYITLLRLYSVHPQQRGKIWRAKLHSDGSMMNGWFVLGIGKDKGHQITYHLPISRWAETSFAETLEWAPEWDGHTSNDVIQRLKSL